MEQTTLGYELPPSPFAEEKVRIGFVPRKRPRRGGVRLTDYERYQIGRTVGPIAPVAAEFGISEYYVAVLRRHYRKGEL
jgi:hypothetical protein